MLVPNTPPHVTPNLNELGEMLNHSNAILARYTSDFDCKNVTEWWYVIKGIPLDLKKPKYMTKIDNSF